MNYKKINNILLKIVLICLTISALAILYLAITGDTTLLGDPYYEDKILAPQRALIPWCATMLSIVVTMLMAINQYLMLRHSKKSKS